MKPTDPDSMERLIDRFLEWLKVHNYSDTTVHDRKVYLEKFIAWLQERGIERVTDITRAILERYQRYLHLYRQRNGEPLKIRSQTAPISSIRSWFKWLCRERHMASNPASELIMPRREFRLPTNVLNPSQVEQVLAMPNINEPLGIRDRAIMETLYSSGIRRMELIHLTPQDIDRERGLLLIILGKNKKDRIIPIGDRALAWIDRYIAEVRPQLLVGHQADDALFLSSQGLPLRPTWLSQMIGDYIVASGVKMHGACHLFRHAMATAMLENGADVRIVQEMLGHENLQTTAIYTHVAVTLLKKIHEATHPAKNERSGVDQKPAQE